MIGWKTFAAAAVMAVGMFAGTAQAVTVTFDRITSNASANSAGQLVLNVTDGGTRALFDFSVGGTSPAPGASIAEIYFSDIVGMFAPPPVIVTQVGTNYTAGSASPGNLPGGNLASPAFVVTASLLADPTGANSNAIQFGDRLVLGLNYAAGFGFADFLANLDSGAFRVGLHVRSLVGGQSDAFVNTPAVPVPAVPVPAAGFLMLGALGGLAALRRRRRAA